MCYLILSNGAPSYSNLYNQLYTDISVNSKVCFAVDSNYHVELNSHLKYTSDVYVFEDYFRSHKFNIEILRKYERFNLNNAVFSDYERSIYYSHYKGKDTEFYRKLQSALLSFFEYLYSTKSVKFVIYEETSNAFAYFAWIVANVFKISYIGILPSKFPGRFEIFTTPYCLSKKYEQTMNDISLGKVIVKQKEIKLLKNYLNNIIDIVPDYVSLSDLSKVNLISKYAKIDKLKKFLLGLRFRKYDVYAFQVPSAILLSFHHFKRNVYRYIRTLFLAGYYQEPLKTERYFVYPLHYHPESSTSVFASNYVDELNLITRIAFNLPVGTYLYVKDHKSAYGYESFSFYDSISRLPNVKFINPNINIKKLIQDSLALITLTSTAGYEALLLKKRVLLFGEVFYSYHKNVVKINSFDHLFNVLSRISTTDNPDCSDDYNINFLYSYYINCLEGTLNYENSDCLSMVSKSLKMYIEENYGKNHR